ncbi:hypothetical protein [Levilactobacillus brevis]|uniref:hypothetical protein n=1 Tax=Levilactobacillus brevis TaxID=1580 RepID=UPI000E034CC0|nr:hypothetical protein [Levilactobacillus brevis]UIF29175.1 hypothetical protein KB236_11820 [Levilactobacillus brevis]STX20418.1 Uncharacterised protein [Levilactobacillus brevis]
MPEKSDKELAVELTTAWLAANAQGGQIKVVSVADAQKAFLVFNDTVNSVDSK